MNSKRVHRESYKPESAEEGVEELTMQDEAMMPKTPSGSPMIIYGVYIVLVLLGIGTGFVLAQSPSALPLGSKAGAPASGNAVGVSDSKTFKDSATGVLQKDGLDDEGTHQLIRDGGPSQTVYLVSSVVDLDQFVGKKVTVWGETMAAEKAAWLMDVGKVENKE